eukprot:349894-Chlamydomonas_euryale.AAC.8
MKPRAPHSVPALCKRQQRWLGRTRCCCGLATWAYRAVTPVVAPAAQPYNSSSSTAGEAACGGACLAAFCSLTRARREPSCTSQEGTLTPLPPVTGRLQVSAACPHALCTWRLVLRAWNHAAACARGKSSSPCPPQTHRPGRAGADTVRADRWRGRGRRVGGPPGGKARLRAAVARAPRSLPVGWPRVGTVPSDCAGLGRRPSKHSVDRATRAATAAAAAAAAGLHTAGSTLGRCERPVRPQAGARRSVVTGLPEGSQLTRTTDGHACGHVCAETPRPRFRPQRKQAYARMSLSEAAHTHSCNTAAAIKGAARPPIFRGTARVCPMASWPAQRGVRHSTRPRTPRRGAARSD